MNKDCQNYNFTQSTNIYNANLAAMQSIKNSVNKISALLEYDFRYRYASCNRNVV